MNTNIGPPAEAANQARRLPPLNRDQERALDAAQGVLLGQRRSFLIEGRAGTGKTRLAAAMAARWPGRVACGLPTHRAAAVLYEMMLLDPSVDLARGFTKGATRRPATVTHDQADFDNDVAGIEVDDYDEDDMPRVAVGTIHSLLGLQPVEDADGKERLVPVGRSTVEQFSLLLLDECSMIGTALQRELDALSIPILYLGDRAQLPPVGEVLASCFLTVKDRFVLTEIVRQQRDNPILKVASALRDQQQKQALGIDADMLHSLPPWRPNKPGVFEATMDDVFTAFRANPDGCRLLAYTNATTIEHNRAIREAILGRTETPFINGERCLVRSPVITLSKHGEVNIVIPVNSEPEVVDIRADVVDVKVGGPLWKGRGKEWPPQTLHTPVWRLVLLHEGCRITCNIGRARGMRDDWLSHATQARRWDDRWRIRAALSDIRHPYSITTHTSQGSTYDTVFIDARNLLLGGMADRMTRLRLCYTAATRPSLQLGIYWEASGFI